MQYNDHNSNKYNQDNQINHVVEPMDVDGLTQRPGPNSNGNNK